MAQRDVARFGPFSFDIARGELRRDDQATPLPPRAADVLTHLVKHPGRVLLREELLTLVWGSMGRASADARLNSCVRRLRRALEDNAHASVYIETVHKRGYRFLADVEWVGSVAPFTGPSTAGWRSAVGVLAAVGVVAAALWLPQMRPMELPEGLETDYLRGRHLATRGSEEDARSGRTMLLDVIEVAPQLPGAWSALASAEVTLGRLEEAESYAGEALDRDPKSAEAHRVLAEAALGLRWDLEEAEAHVLRAIDLDPRSSLARSTYAYTLALQERWAEAISQARRGLAMDPVRSLVAGDLAFFMYWAGLNDEAIEQARRALAVEPELASALGAMRLALLSRGDTAAASEPTRRLIELGGDRGVLERAERATPVELQTVYLLWRASQARQRTNAERWVQLAAVRVELGDMAGAAAAGRNALAAGARGLPMLLVDPRFDTLRSFRGVRSTAAGRAWRR